MIWRSQLAAEITEALHLYPVVALLGPRQCGKTTLARTLLSPDDINYFDLEDPRSLARLDEPMLALEPLRGLIVLDEIQRRPDLFPVLRVLADQNVDRTFLVLGSAAPGLLSQSSETLAGRIHFVRMHGFSLLELLEGETDKDDSFQTLQAKRWLRGGFPQSFLFPTDAASQTWRRNFIQTFVQRDLPAFGHAIQTGLMTRLWAMLAHYHGQTLNSQAIGNALDISHQHVRRYIDILEGYYLIQLLKPWHSNARKREVKAPKLYFTDCGLLHTQLGIETPRQLLEHPMVGASWEGFALQETLRRFANWQPWFWSVHSGAEIDLILQKHVNIGVEFKRTDAPKVGKVASNAAQDIGLRHLWVVYPNGPRFSIDRHTTAISLQAWLALDEESLAG